MSEPSIGIILLNTAKKFPTITICIIAATILAIFITAGIAADGSLEPAFRGGVYLALLIILSSIQFGSIGNLVILSIKEKNEEAAAKIDRTRKQFKLGHLASALFVLTAFSAATWLTFTTTRYALNHNYFCDSAGDNPRDEKEPVSALRIAFSFLTGVEGVEQSPQEGGMPCAFSELRLEVVASPIYQRTDIGPDQQVSARLPFSHRRSSCSNSSSGSFEACLPAGASITSAEVVDLSSRNRADFAQLVPGYEAQQCANVSWRATSGGRTGIGECRYHGLISFAVELNGAVKGEQSVDRLVGAPTTEGQTIRGEANSVFISFADVIPATNEDGGALAPVEEWSYFITGAEWEKRWFRHSRLWMDSLSKQRYTSRCLDATPQDEPPGYWISVKCSAFGSESDERD